MTTMSTMNLPVKLTHEELDQRRDKIASLIHNKTCVEIEKKTASDVFNKRLKEIDTDIQQQAREIRERAEYREVLVSRETDYKLGVEQVIREDTGEPVDSRPLKSEERQMSISPRAPQDHEDDRRAELTIVDDYLAQEAHLPAGDNGA